MPTTDIYSRVLCADIIVSEDRQRKTFDTSDIDGSIKKYGVLNPVIITKGLELIAGERRLRSSIKNALPDIPVRFFEDLDPFEAKIIELIENVQRQDLPWRDEARAVFQLHALYVAQTPEWTQKQTAEQIHAAEGTVSLYLTVARELDNPAIKEAPGLKAAYNVLDRLRKRTVDNVMSELLEATAEAGASPAPIAATPAATDAIMKELRGEAPSAPPTPVIIPVEESILQASFINWAKTYSGPKFNFIHCDFPYGIDVFAGAWSGAKTHTTYDDSPDIWWQLLEALCANRERLFAYSGHLMMWFSMDYYYETLEFLRKNAPELDMQAFPLYWHKSDNAGIMPDPQRGPRRVVETALIGSWKDRLVLKSVSNAYAAPTDKRWHPHTKPEPVLRHFFQMFVDDGTIMLDPTCGGGSSLRAAEAAGAKLVTGLERDPEHCVNARQALKSFRVLRSIK